MNISEAGLLLTKASAYDRRTVGRGDCEAWAEVMTRADIALPDALEAVTQHFQTSNDWLMPVHVTRYVTQIRKTRMNNAPVMLIPGDLSLAVEREWVHEFTAAVKAGEADPHVVADRRLGITRPAGVEIGRDMSVLQLRPRSA